MSIATASLVDVLIGATTDVFETMIFRRVEARNTVWGHLALPKSQVVGTVGFAGSATGLVAFHASIAAAREITGAMLGTETADDAMPDAIGEVTNMVAGAFRTRMAAFQDAWAISVPTVTVGSDFYIKPIGTADRVIITFTMGVHELFVELIISATPHSAI